MKNLISGMLALASIIFSANAQDTGKISRHQHHHRQGRVMEGLNLSASQKEQMKTAMESTKQKLAELDKNEDITVREFKTRKAAILESQKEQINQLLTPEQREKLAQNKINHKARHDQFMDKKLDKMISRLDLSGDQLTKIKANREAGQAKARAIKENSQLSETEKKEQLMALSKEQKSSFKQLLTPEQIKKMEEMRKERKEKNGKK